MNADLDCFVQRFHHTTYPARQIPAWQIVPCVIGNTRKASRAFPHDAPARCIHIRPRCRNLTAAYRGTTTSPNVPRTTRLLAPIP
jgi:hypothetical protein